MEGIVGHLNYYYVPIVVVAIGSYFTADVFLEVYGMAIDTVFLCFLEDLEVNDGTKAKPYYMPKKLQEIVKKYNEQGTIRKQKSKKGDSGSSADDSESDEGDKKDKKKDKKKKDKKKKDKKKDKKKGEKKKK